MSSLETFDLYRVNLIWDGKIAIAGDIDITKRLFERVSGSAFWQYPICSIQHESYKDTPPRSTTHFPFINDFIINDSAFGNNIVAYNLIQINTANVRDANKTLPSETVMKNEIRYNLYTENWVNYSTLSGIETIIPHLSNTI